MSVLSLLSKLKLTLLLIFLAVAVLLASDWNRRVKSTPSKALPNLALMQIMSTPLLDDHVSGIIHRLNERGILKKDQSNLHLFNPQGDYGLANAIARELAYGPYDILISSSTPALQIVAQANADVQKRHVFGAVTDPYGAGVGITGTQPNEHPSYMAGLGTFQPVEAAFEILKELNPHIKKVGVVWNASESNSEACVIKARETCTRLGITLEEQTINATAEVSEAIRAIMAKDIDAFWIGGDVIMTSAVGTVVHLADQRCIPVFTNDPTDSAKGALFGIGADYFSVGQQTGDIVADILEGKDPASFSIVNCVPERLTFNQDKLNALPKAWKMTPKIKARISP